MVRPGIWPCNLMWVRHRHWQREKHLNVITMIFSFNHFMNPTHLFKKKKNTNYCQPKYNHCFWKIHTARLKLSMSSDFIYLFTCIAWVKKNKSKWKSGTKNPLFPILKCSVLLQCRKEYWITTKHRQEYFPWSFSGGKIWALIRAVITFL